MECHDGFERFELTMVNILLYKVDEILPSD